METDYLFQEGRYRLAIVHLRGKMVLEWQKGTEREIGYNSRTTIWNSAPVVPTQVYHKFLVDFSLRKDEILKKLEQYI